MAEDLHTVAVLRTTAEADIIRGKLEAAGIAAVLVEPERAADGTAAGRVQVQVSQPDFERAMQLLFPIPKLKPGGRQAAPSWQCPKCGEQVMGEFPACWSCGAPREGAASGASQPVLPASGVAPSVVAPSVVAPSVVAPSGGLPKMPPPPPPPLIETAPSQDLPVRNNPPVGAPLPTLNVPRIPAASGATVNRPAMNGESSTKAVPLPPRRLARSGDDEHLKIVVPAWDPGTGTSAGQAKSRKGNAIDADDRAARRAWWTAVFGILCPPLLVYSISVVLVLGLTNRPLSTRGNRFFYGALAVNALIVAAFFALFGWRK